MYYVCTHTCTHTCASASCTCILKVIVTTLCGRLAEGLTTLATTAGIVVVVIPAVVPPWRAALLGVRVSVTRGLCNSKVRTSKKAVNNPVSDAVVTLQCRFVNDTVAQ